MSKPAPHDAVNDLRVAIAKPGTPLRIDPSTWAAGIATVAYPSPDRATITLAKPNGEGRTERHLDPEALLFVLALMIPGGRLAVENKGPERNYYYVRLIIDGEDTSGSDFMTTHGRKRRVHLTSAIATAPRGYIVQGGAEFHSLHRRDLLCEPREIGESRHCYGVAEAIRFSCFRFAEVLGDRPASFPAGFGPEEYALLVGDARARLEKLELGTARRTERN